MHSPLFMFVDASNQHGLLDSMSDPWLSKSGTKKTILDLSYIDLWDITWRVPPISIPVSAESSDQYDLSRCMSDLLPKSSQ